MAKVFKEEYQNCTVTVRTQFGRKVNIDTATADPNAWIKLEEFAFLFEDEGTLAPKKVKKAAPVATKTTPTETPEEKHEEIAKEVAKENSVELSDLSLKELRAKFPDIKDTSKAGFLKQLGQ